MTDNDINHIKPKIEVSPEKKFIGKRMTMSFAKNKTLELWENFMPRRKEIINKIGTELYSIEIYPLNYFDNFNPSNSFEKWAALEVTDFEIIPGNMESLISPAGKYAIFIHKGSASEGPKTYQYIFRTWLPKSDYLLDTRPHFAIMGEKYIGEDPNSEEELWIPIKLR